MCWYNFVRLIASNERNPRHNDAGVDAVATSLKEFGWRQPIVVDEQGVVVVGHTRLLAARQLGLPEVPVHVATGLSPAQIQAYRIADNQTATLSSWDDDKLTAELMDLERQGYDLDLTGFDDNRIQELLHDGIEQPGDPDAIPLPPDQASTKPGDLWILGNHRLLCGDSAKSDDVDRLLAGATIQLVNTDPPYNVAVEPRSNNAVAAGLSSFPTGKKMHLGLSDLARHPEKSQATHQKLRAKDRPLSNDAMTDEEFDLTLNQWFGNLARVLEPGRGFYIWGGYANTKNYRITLEKNGLYFSQSIIWDKQHPVLGRKDFMSGHEWCFYGWREGAAHQFFGPNNISDIWAVKKLNHTQMVHLTEKPVELAARAIEYSSKFGENVLDLFGGSGSSLIACEQLGRKAYLMELDPLYCDIIVTRWQQFTGKEAIRTISVPSST